MKKLAIIGAAIVDILVSGADESVFRSGSQPAEGIVMSHGGGALNEALVLRHLGADVTLHTLLGADAAGESVLQHMAKRGLSTHGVRLRPDISTSVNVVLVQPGGERSFLTDPRASQRRLRPEDIPSPFPEDAGIMCFASIFVFPEMKIPDMAELFRRAKAQGITVCADMTRPKNGESVRDLAPALQYVDYLFPNASEAMLLTGEQSVEAAAEAIFAAGVKNVLIKCGSEGCYVRNSEGAFRHSAAKARRCVDSTGAGDSFVGGFLYGLAREESLTDCLRRASYCGARAVEHLGATAWTEAAGSKDF